MTSRDIQTRAKLDMMADTGNLKGMSIFEYRICQFALSEIIYRGKSKQFNSRVAQFFKENGYRISKDSNNVNYIIER